ncbi:DUF431 domain protein [Cordyceps militaris CM01]|uniref:DUF431 domain protein n=1 Tax=Cordyceps militaris (strain CM01) TaxID=983644 RepID=G3JCB1_CORMM|nr:DUF431 domain protein [Cordyceps militaris CM01]EGX93776.1 DUF431 domain protein [Cordyceps militaris CM01]
MVSAAKTIIVEHLDPELGPWSELEYKCIAKESHERNSDFILSCLPEGFKVPEDLASSPAFKAEHRGVEELYADSRNQVCLLDPAASKDLSPEDGDSFNVFLFGGILGDDPPRDRTSELRKKGFAGRRLGAKQMTTDTAVRVTRIVVQDKIALDKIDYVDFPELKFNKYESTEMPFRYVKVIHFNKRKNTNYYLSTSGENKAWWLVTPDILPRGRFTGYTNTGSASGNTKSYMILLEGAGNLLRLDSYRPGRASEAEYGILPRTDIDRSASSETNP